jgi:hypothetical protein
MQQRTSVTERVFWDNNPLTGFPIETKYIYYEKIFKKSRY